MTARDELLAAARELEQTGGILYTTTATPAVQSMADRILGLDYRDAARVLRSEAEAVAE